MFKTKQGRNKGKGNCRKEIKEKIAYGRTKVNIYWGRKKQKEQSKKEDKYMVRLRNKRTKREKKDKMLKDKQKSNINNCNRNMN